jgi:adenosylcobinamide amidohydrolase
MAAVLSLSLTATGTARGEAAVSMVDRVAEFVRVDHPYTPAPAEDVVATATPEGVVEMETFTVMESLNNRDLETALARQAADTRARKFTPTKGGLIASKTIGNKQAEVGLWPAVIERNVKNIGQDFMLQVNFLRMEW